MALAQKGSMSRLLEQRLVLTRQWIQDLRGFLYKHYWVTSKTMQMLRRRPTEQFGEQQGENEFNVQPQVVPSWLQEWLDNQGGYLIGNMRTGRPDFRFYSLGNSLACLFGLLTPPKQRALFQLVLHNRKDLMAQMPMRICHPPMDLELPQRGPLAQFAVVSWGRDPPLSTTASPGRWRADGPNA